MTTTILVTRCLLVSTLLIWCGCALAQSPPEPLHVWRFAQAEPPTNERLSRHTWILQESSITFNNEALRSFRDLNQPSLPRMVMDFSQSLTREVVVRSRNASNSLAILIEGRLPGDPPGEFTLSMRGEAVSGRLQIGPRVWAIEPRGDGFHRLLEIDPERMPRD